MSLWRRLCCAVGRHKELLRVGRPTPETEHVLCPYCRREFSVHHGLRSVLLWEDVAYLHRLHGYDDDAARAALIARMEQQRS